MIAKVFFCASALLVQSAFSQYVGRIGPNPGPYGCGCGVSSTGGGLPVTSASPFPPIGVTVVSENTYEGTLNVGGTLPFLATVALEGVLPTVGSGTVSYGCGNGAVGIAVEEGPISTGIVPNGYGPAGVGYGPAGVGYGPAGVGYGPAGVGYGPGCGYGAIY